MTLAQESEDIYDTIEWIIQQPWCNGSVTMQGNSWLGVSQINHAARDCHPALKCIAPWEGHAVSPFQSFIGMSPRGKS